MVVGLVLRHCFGFGAFCNFLDDGQFGSAAKFSSAGAYVEVAHTVARTPGVVRGYWYENSGLACQ